MSQHIMVDQHPAQRNFAAQDLLFDFERHELKVEPNDSELHDVFSAAFQQENFPAVHVLIKLLIEHADVNARYVVRLHRHRHVVLVDVHLLVRLGRL